jgi:hypothetical protein
VTPSRNDRETQGAAASHAEWQRVLSQGYGWRRALPERLPL